MIFGCNVLQGLGIKFDFSNLTIERDEVVVPMQDTDSSEHEAFYVHEPEAITSATECIQMILDAKFKKLICKKLPEKPNRFLSQKYRICC